MPAVAPDICYGQSDVDLAESFETELKGLHSKLAHVRQPFLVSSPLHRCLRLAEALAQHFKTPLVNKDARLMELNFGEWELKSWADIPQGVVTEWSDAHIKQAPPNGESYLDLHTRSKQFFDELTQMKDIESVLVLTHAGVIRALVSEIAGMPLREASKIEVNYGSVTHISVENGITQLKQVNN